MTTSVRDAELTVEPAGRTVEAGQPLRVTLRFRGEQPPHALGGQVRLVRKGAVAHFERGWMGAGGTVSFRRVAVLDRADLDADGWQSNGPDVTREVMLRVPPGEATVDGFLVQQHYAVMAQLHLPGGDELEADAALRVTSAAAEHSWVTGISAEVHDAGAAVLGVEDLSSRSLSGGVPISGTVTVVPRRAGHVRGARVELVLDEHVPARADVPLEEARVRTTVVAAVAVTGPLDLEPGRVLRLPFTLDVPGTLPAPSISAPEFTLRWLLRAVLDRPVRPDATATLELCGSTAP